MLDQQQWRYELSDTGDGREFTLFRVDPGSGDDAALVDDGESLIEGAYIVVESDAEAMAIAKLITAAPDLLAALEFLTGSIDDTDRNGVCYRVPSALETARIALNKARGKE